MPAAFRSPEHTQTTLDNGDSAPDAERDRALMARIAARDAAAMGELYDSHATLLYSVALHVLRDREEAEDITQAVFLSLSERASQYDPAFGTPVAWLVTMAKNRALDHLRRLSTRARHHGRLLRDAEHEQEDRQAPPSHADETALIRSAVDSLSADQRQVVDLAFYGMRTHSEIAGMLSLPLGTVKARIRRGLLDMRAKCAALL